MDMANRSASELKALFKKHLASGQEFLRNSYYDQEDWLLENDWRRELADAGEKMSSLEMQVMVDWLRETGLAKKTFTRM